MKELPPTKVFAIAGGDVQIFVSNSISTAVPVWR